MRRSQQENKKSAFFSEPELTYEETAQEESNQPPVPEPVKEKKKPKKTKSPKPPKEFQRSFGDLLQSRVVIGFLCVFAALIIAFVALPMVQGMVSERVSVVTLAANVEKGTILTEEMLTVSEIGAIDCPSNAAVSMKQVLGTYTKYDMLAGDILISSKLSKEQPLLNSYLYDLPEDKVAISVSIKGLAEGLSGKLKPGDIVTVYATFNTSDAETDYTATQPPELKYVRVLAVSDSAGEDIDVDAGIDTLSGDADKNSEDLPATITLMANDVQAAALAGLDVNATIHVGLAAREIDSELCSTMLAAQDEYIAQLPSSQKESEGNEPSGTPAPNNG